MSNKITDYLNEHLLGDVVSGDNVRRQFSTDSSITSLTPNLVVHPRVTDDVRKIARFTWRLAERGQILPLTMRGNGTGFAGASIGRGVIVSTPAHMSSVMELDLKYKLVRVQPGISLESLNQAVSTQGLCLPINNGYSRAKTVGGAIADNLIGRHYLKYGSMREWTEKLEVVLANGEIIQTGRINKKELNRRKGLQTLEGEIYRSIDNLITDNPDVVEGLSNKPCLDATGYALDMVKSSDGMFDLTPLFMGSQGTLGVVTQAILRLSELSSNGVMIAASLPDETDLSEVSNKLSNIEPTAIEFIDRSALQLVYELTGYQPWKKITDKLPKALLFVEFDEKFSSRKVRKAANVLNDLGVLDAKISNDDDEFEELTAVYDSVSSITNYNDSGLATIPLLASLSIHPDNIESVVSEIRELANKSHVNVAIWGDLGSGLITVKPIINLANLGHRQIIFRLLDKISELVIKFDGSLCGDGGGGRLLQPWVKAQYDRETEEVFSAVRKIFDPFGIMNSGVRDNQIDRTKVMAMLRQEYINDRFSNYNLRG